MNHPIETVVRVANTPAQAKIFVAMLQAEGIPARIEGEALTDEFAASRSLLNLMGTKVMVPTSSLARAREILQPTVVDPDELERQAMAAAPAPTSGANAPARVMASPTASPSRSISITGLLLVLATGAAVLFAFLWQQAAGSAFAMDQEHGGNYARSIETHADGLLSTWTDTDRDGLADVGVVTDRDGKVLQRIRWQPGVGYVVESNEAK